jgi:hypothetical protein
MSSTASSLPASTARSPASNPVRYAAGMLPVGASQPYSVRSFERALATVVSPSGPVSTSCALTWVLLVRATSRGFPDFSRRNRWW